ncbi:hypothetical protein [Nocardioides dongxiaopingii]|uniref:hypothetical protein n=1 Tax=Nocardioides dongxiaopingii TaxID=2576036 RepID=UPI0010C768AB|nr:hypothetical protein [Nocardioides dongxiaopingii]
MSASAPPLTARRATWSVLRSPSAIGCSVALVALTLVWAVPDWRDGDRTASVTAIVTTLAIAATLVHGMVRRERGFATSSHRLAPLVIGLGMVACYLVVNAVDPILGTGDILVSAVGIAVILTAFSEGERWYRARQDQGTRG